MKIFFLIKQRTDNNVDCDSNPIQNFISQTPIITISNYHESARNNSEFEENSNSNSTPIKSVGTLDQTETNRYFFFHKCNSKLQHVPNLPNPSHTSQDNIDSSQNQSLDEPLLRRSNRIRKTPAHLQDFIFQQAVALLYSQDLDKKRSTFQQVNPFL